MAAHCYKIALADIDKRLTQHPWAKLSATEDSDFRRSLSESR
jgi:hypothetical protein